MDYFQLLWKMYCSLYKLKEIDWWKFDIKENKSEDFDRERMKLVPLGKNPGPFYKEEENYGATQKTSQMLVFPTTSWQAFFYKTNEILTSIQ